MQSDETFQVVPAPLPHGGTAIQKPDRIIVHAMAEYTHYDGHILHARDLLDVLKLSVHALVTPSGVVIRCRTDEQQAWHAKAHNRNSLGIEFLVPGVHTYETFLAAMKGTYLADAEYFAGAAQVRAWVRRYGIKRVERHSDVDPDRKYDPGRGFPWSMFLRDIGV